jgi:hypothetical protein
VGARSVVTGCVAARREALLGVWVPGAMLLGVWLPGARRYWVCGCQERGNSVCLRVERGGRRSMKARSAVIAGVYV